VWNPSRRCISSSSLSSSTTDASQLSGAEPSLALTHQFGKPKRVVRANSKYNNLIKHFIINISIQQVRNKYGDIADEVVIEELTTIVQKQTFHPVDFRDLNLEQRQFIISCLLLLEEKCKPNIEFDRLKARLVASGLQQDKILFPNRISSTVDLTSFLFIESLLARSGSSPTRTSAWPSSTQMPI
jgi:hypothetical protein